MSNPTTPTLQGDGSLAYAGTVIRKRGPMLNLTDMWRAADSPANRRPAQWLALDETAQFRAYLNSRLAEAELRPGSNIVQDDICAAPPDGLTLAVRGTGGGTWAHWQLAIAYARYLSPAFHLWCNDVLRTVMEQPDLVAPKDGEGLFRYLELRFGSLDRRLDVLDRHAGDLMFLAASSQDLLLDKRRHFSERSQAVMRAVVAVEPYEGRCPLLRGGSGTESGGRLPARGGIRPLLPPWAEPAGTRLADLPGVPYRPDDRRLPGALRQATGVPGLPGPGRRSPATGRGHQRPADLTDNTPPFR